MRLRRVVLWSACGVAALAALAALGLLWASRSETVLRWGVERLAQRLPCELTIEGLQGTLSAPVRLARVVCEREAMRVEATDVELEWAPWELRDGRLHVERLRAASLTWTTQPSNAAPVPPDDLRLPVEVRVDSLEIDRATRISGEQRVELRGIAAGYEGGARQHSVTVTRLTSAWGSLAGDLKIGAEAPLPVSARLEIRSEWLPEWPVQAQVDLAGTLSELNARLQAATAHDLRVSAQLVLLPFDSNPLRAVSARSEPLDLSAIWPELPRTALTVELDGSGERLQTLAGRVRVTNGDPGPVDRQRLPLSELRGDLVATAGAIRLARLELLMPGAGQANGSAALLDDRSLELDLNVRSIDLRTLRSDLRATRLAGTVQVLSKAGSHRIVADVSERNVRLAGEATVSPERIRIDRLVARAEGAEITASGTLGRGRAMAWRGEGRLRNFDPARFGDFPAARINGTVEAGGVLQPQWRADLRYRLLASRFRGQPLGGSGTLSLSPQHVSGADAQLNLGGNSLRLKGAFGRAGDRLAFDLRAPNLGIAGIGIKGTARAAGTISGTRTRPALDIEGEATALQYREFAVQRWTLRARLEQADDPKLEVHSRMAGARRNDIRLDELALDATGSLSSHAAEVKVSSPVTRLSSQIDGGWNAAAQTWTGAIQRMKAEGEYPLDLAAPVRLELGRAHAVLGPAELHFEQTEIRLGETRFSKGRLLTAGELHNLRVSRLLALIGKPQGLETSLVLSGRWSLDAGDAINGTLDIRREAGDVTIVGEDRLPLGVSEATMQLRAAANRLEARFALVGAGLSAEAEAHSVLEQRGEAWGLSGAAPLKVKARADLKSVRAVAALFSRGVTTDGSLALEVQGEGTIANPALTGKLSGENLRIENVESGIFLRDGVLQASFGEEGIHVDRLVIKGGDGTFTASGKLQADSRAPNAQIDWAAKNLAIVQHPDLRLTVSGAGRLALQDSRITLTGELRAERGRVELRGNTAPALGSDVVVAGRETPVPISERALNSTLDLRLDLGSDFRVSGRGAQMRLGGNVRLHSSPGTPLQAQGDIKVEQGTYEAYGQLLTIEKGVLRFAGAVDNPAIEVRAMRKNQEVEAGVEVTGTARDPRARLVSDPDVPDPEKLSWLVLGNRVESGSTADAQKLQASAVAMAAGLGTLPLQQQLKRAVGLDEISYIPPTGDMQGGVVEIGKRVSDRVYVSHQRGLSAATNTLRISYQLSRRWSLRTESGSTNAVDLFFTLSFD